jgi:glycosyltransferase involved in cell wall biosynthesis
MRQVFPKNLQGGQPHRNRHVALAAADDNGKDAGALVLWGLRMRVVVVMSTFRGERFIAEQLRSILEQLPEDGRLLVRDDGSDDATVERVAAFNDSRVSLERGPNLGFARSFFSLLASVPDDADMVMLADQDDVWLPGKIDRAAAQLAGRADPVLYCSRLRLVDESLRPMGVSSPWPRGPSFSNALAENIVTGCTVALNRAALELVLRLGNPQRIHFHDWWMYLVVSAFGTVIADPVPTVLYRQHGANVVGRGAGARRYLVNLRFVRRKSWVHIMFNQIQNFRAVHGAALSPPQRHLLDAVFNPQSAGAIARLVLSPRRYRQTLLDDILLRLLVVGEFLSGRGLLPAEARSSNPA